LTEAGQSESELGREAPGVNQSVQTLRRQPKQLSAVFFQPSGPPMKTVSASDVEDHLKKIDDARRRVVSTHEGHSGMSMESALRRLKDAIEDAKRDLT